MPNASLDTHELELVMPDNDKANADFLEKIGQVAPKTETPKPTKKDEE